MPFDPSGVFTRLYDWTDDRDNGVKIDADRMDAEHDDFAAAFNSMFSGAQPFRAPARTVYGTVSLPGWAFEGDADTGVYRAAANTLGLAAGGTDVRISSAGMTFNGVQFPRENRANTFTADNTFTNIVADQVAIDANAGDLELRHDNTSSDIVGVVWKDKDDVSAWRLELKTDNSLNFLRGTSAAGKEIHVAGNKLWHEGNDGASSGLDADKLDGFEAAAFPRLSATNSFTGTNTFVAVNVSVNTGGLLTFNSDGTTNRTCQEFQIAGAAQWRAIIEADGSLAFNSPTGKTFKIRGETAWHAGNDGPGSGLDADLLDGQQGASYARVNANNTFANDNTFNGGVTFSTGVMTPFFESDGVSDRNAARFRRSGTVDWTIIHRTAGHLDFVPSGAKEFRIDGNVAFHAGNVTALLDALGLSTSWADLTASRVAGTNYRNTTGKPLEISVSYDTGTGKYLEVSPDATTWTKVSEASGYFSGFIPINHYYRVNTGAIKNWAERR